MRYLTESRRQWTFVLDENVVLEQNGIKADGINIWFPRGYTDNNNIEYRKINKEHEIKGHKTFKTVKECEAWFKDFLRNRTMNVEKRTKEFADLKTKSLTITDEDWRLMQKRMANPSRFQKEDFRIFEDYLAHTFPDRDNERFSLPVLRAFERTLPGKSKMIAHQWFTPGQGTYFKARVEKMSAEETKTFVGEHPSPKFEQALKQVTEKEGAIHWLVGSFYVRADKKELIDDIDDGSASKSSIGFRAPRPAEIKDVDGNLMWMEYQITEGQGAEAVEGSIVGVESQYGARITKSADEEDDPFKGKHITLEEATKPFANEHSCRLKDPSQYDDWARENCYRKHDGKCIDYIFGIKKGTSETQALRYPVKVWNKADARKHCKGRSGSFEAASEKSSKGGKLMKLELKSIGFTKEIDVDEDTEKALQPVFEEADDFCLQKSAEIEDQYKAQIDEFESVKTIIGEKYSVEEVKEIQAKSEKWDTEGEAMRKDFIEETIRLGVLAKMIEDKAVEDKRKFLSDLPFSKIVVVRDDYRKAVDKLYPRKGQLPVNPDDPNADGNIQEKEISTTPDSRYSTD